jgi:hypothetical protein
MKREQTFKTTFRNWFQEMYFRNRDERCLYKQSPVEPNEYLQRNKSFLKKLFRKQRNENGNY